MTSCGQYQVNSIPLNNRIHTENVLKERVYNWTSSVTQYDDK